MINEKKLRKIIQNVIIKELSDVDRAKDMAMDIHSKQVRRSSGLPYFVHPFRVYQKAKQFKLSKQHQLLALLHDVYEDGDNPTRILKSISEKFGNNIANKIKILSHDKGIDYQQYLLKIAKSAPIVFDVKLLDMMDNLTDNPRPKQKLKYKNAIEYLVENGVVINPKFQKTLYLLLGLK